MGFQHRVVEGECFSSLAAKYGFPSERVLYELEENRELRERRPDPNILFPGDEVFIPERKTKQVACEDGVEHCFEVTLPKVELRLALRGDNGEPHAHGRCHL